jgi:hypothetical protein
MMQGSVLLIDSHEPLLISVVFIGSCSSYYALPQYGLGVNYEVITWSPVGQSSSDAQASFTVVSQQLQAAPTVVHIRLPPFPSNKSASS